MLEKLAKRHSRSFIERDRIERHCHMFQPRISLREANSKTSVRFPQTQPPPALGLVFIAAEKLNEEGSELFDSALEAISRKQRPQDRVFANARVECSRQPPATCFTA
jgi:hypothetical protein